VITWDVLLLGHFSNSLIDLSNLHPRPPIGFLRFATFFCLSLCRGVASLLEPAFFLPSLPLRRVFVDTLTPTLLSQATVSHCVLIFRGYPASAVRQAPPFSLDLPFQKVAMRQACFFIWICESGSSLGQQNMRARALSIFGLSPSPALLRFHTLPFPPSPILHGRPVLTHFPGRLGGFRAPCRATLFFSRQLVRAAFLPPELSGGRLNSPTFLDLLDRGDYFIFLQA